MGQKDKLIHVDMSQKGQTANWTHTDRNKKDNFGLWIKAYTIWTKRQHTRILHVPIISLYRGGELRQLRQSL